METRKISDEFLIQNDETGNLMWIKIFDNFVAETGHCSVVNNCLVLFNSTKIQKLSVAEHEKLKSNIIESKSWIQTKNYKKDKFVFDCNTGKMMP